jgi:hypothetical protein
MRQTGVDNAKTDVFPPDLENKRTQCNSVAYVTDKHLQPCEDNNPCEALMHRIH